MKHHRIILIAWTGLFAGCGESAPEKLARSPQVQQKLKDIKERDRRLAEKQQQIIDQARQSTSDLEPLLNGEPSLNEPSLQPDAGTQIAPTEDQSPKADSLAPWRRLRFGLDREAVRQLLGAPTVTKNDRFLEYWHYGHGADTGKVSLLRHSGKTLGWDLPIQP